MDKIVCVGKNYRKRDTPPDAVVPDPVLFLKPPSVLRTTDGTAPLRVAYRPNVGEVHFEVEVVARIGRDGERWSEAEALAAVDGWTVGLDMTLRERWRQQVKDGHPWDTSKVFPDSAIVGTFVKSPPEGTFRLFYDGALRQEATVEEMIFSPARCLSLASHTFPLFAGDLVFFGAPPGVGPVFPGGTARCEWGPIRYDVTWH